MDDEVCPPPEGLPTVWTEVRLLSGVDSLMSIQIRPLIEPFPTLQAFIWFIFGVDTLMPLEVPSPGKDLPALEAFTWVFSAESSTARPLGESFPTSRAPAGLAARMDALVFDKV